MFSSTLVPNPGMFFIFPCFAAPSKSLMFFIFSFLYSVPILFDPRPSTPLKNQHQ